MTVFQAVSKKKNTGFTVGKEYTVNQKGNKWTMVDDTGKERVLEMGTKDEKWTLEYFDIKI